MTKNHDLVWIDETIPQSTLFDDTYYSKAGGLDETGYVFIKGNGLFERFTKVHDFTIAELGFGTGLNFLVALREWKRLAPAASTLSFISFEQFPLSKQNILKALTRWPELHDSSQLLFADWNPEHEFFQFNYENVSLTVFLSDANIRLPQLEILANAWFLDGFSPAKNPQLWNDELLQCVHQKTAHDGTFATYTAAGWVRRNLASAGFEVERIKGHAGKREMMIGRKVNERPPSDQQKNSTMK